MRSLLREAGYKATPGRLALLEFLRASGRPLSIQEILRGLRDKKVDKATIYRTLETMKKIGLVRKVGLGHGHADYEFAEDDHHHLICNSCGKIEDFADCGLENLGRKVLKGSRDFAQIERHSLEFFGLCKRCAEKKAPKASKS